MKDEQRIKTLEEEVKVLKNEIKTVLLDLREQYLSIQNPFGSSCGTATTVPTSVQKENQPEEPATESSPGMRAGGQGKVPESAASPAGEIKSVSLKQIQDGLIPSQYKDIAGTEESQTPSRNIKPRLWQGAETDNEEGVVSPQERKKEHNFFTGKSKVDLVVVAGLTHWIDQATAKLGKERSEILVEMSCAMGHLPEKLKDALIRMIRISHHEPKGQSIIASDYLSLLAQLENLLADPKQQEKALLSILSMMKESQNG